MRERPQFFYCRLNIDKIREKNYFLCDGRKKWDFFNKKIVFSPLKSLHFCVQL